MKTGFSKSSNQAGKLVAVKQMQLKDQFIENPISQLHKSNNSDNPVPQPRSASFKFFLLNTELTSILIVNTSTH